MRFIFAAVLAIALVACETNTPIESVFDEKSTVWSIGFRKTADDTFLLAQLANNAYDPDRRQHYILPEYVKEIERSPSRGRNFEYVIYEIDLPELPTERVIAFRGTDEFGDWIFGNLFKLQNGKAIKLYDRVRADFSGDISVTGDSLGGGLAIFVDRCRPVKTRLAINTSPRHGGKCPYGASGNPNVVSSHTIIERGETLQALRIPFLDGTQLYTPLNCTTKGSSIEQHSVLLVSRCLTRIAAIESQEARVSISANPKIFLESDPESSLF